MKKFLKANFLKKEDYNKAIGPSMFHNCLACALSLTYKVEDNAQFNLNPNWSPTLEISKAFKAFAKKEGIRVKEVKSLDCLKGKIGFIVLGFFPIQINYFLFKEEVPNVDFHIIRVNPDGTYTNKATFSAPARDLESLQDSDLDEYREELNSGNYKIYVLK